MITLISGASHTGKTVLAGQLAKRTGALALSIDHLKMGLIRSGQTSLTPCSSDEQLTEYLWPIVREMIRTAIENRQDLIVEGCYIPADWADDFSAAELSEIHAVCLVLDPETLSTRFEQVLDHACDAERRLSDDFTLKQAIEDNQKTLDEFQDSESQIVLIQDDYESRMELLISSLA